VLSGSLSAWADERGYRLDDDDGESLARAMESWQPFPDTVPALRAAKDAGLGLWIISNTDRAIIGHTLRQLEVEFEGVTVAEDVGAYKPARPPFDKALADMGVPSAEVLHVAFGFKYDIATAQQLGLRTAWVNRHREPAPGPERPDFEWSDLWPLAGVVAAG
jgi:2-haloalkanoic acid dehalogenase type II